MINVWTNEKNDYFQLEELRMEVLCIYCLLKARWDPYDFYLMEHQQTTN